jgi:quercetin dioxygenase-like cupin family protein
MRVLIAVIAACAAILQSSSARAPIVWSASDLKWVDNPALTGAQQAILWGDPAKTEYGALKRIPAGARLPMHSHTNETRALLVAGTLIFTLDGSAAKELPPQSYVSIPGGVQHAASCKAGADCVYFETSRGAYDVKTP